MTLPHMPANLIVNSLTDLELSFHSVSKNAEAMPHPSYWAVRVPKTQIRTY